MTIQEWCFSAFDTWFFREARPFNTATSNELASLFPPSPRTIMGAIRTAIGDCKNVDWKQFKENNEDYNPLLKARIDELKAQIGDDSGEEPFGKLKIIGSYLICNRERLYPVPAHFMVKENKETKEKHCVFLEINEKNKIECDLGNIVLPKLDEKYKGAKPLENCWVTFNDMELILNGLAPSKITKPSDLFEHETRIGIARDNETRAVKEGQLYRTKHLRPKEPELKVGVLVEGLEDNFTPKTPFQMRFGGEGRMATVEINLNANKDKPFKINAQDKNIKGILLVLLTPADFNKSWIPTNEDGKEIFNKEEEKNAKGEIIKTTWVGEIKGIKLEIISAVVDKAIHEGGWDLQGNKQKGEPRPVKSLVPAGSVYFCRITNGVSTKGAIEKLQDFKKVGRETELGRGELAIGVWK